MQRRNFTKTIFALGALAPLQRFRNPNDPIIGHGDFRYKIDTRWCQAIPELYPVKDCHEMAMDRSGRIYMSTNDTRNNILVFDQNGKVLDAFGRMYPGAHGLTLHDENGEEFLYLTDYERNAVFKLNLKGDLIQSFHEPVMTDLYPNKTDFHPTETAIAPNGDVYIADGYGLDYILVYDAKGRFKFHFGGKGTHPGALNNAHGVALDYRKPDQPCVLVSSRADNVLKRFALDGTFLEAIPLPGAYICRPVVHGKAVYFAVLISKLPWDSQSGFLCILDENNKLVSVPGGSDPKALEAERPLYQTVQVFKHPHDVLVDADENLYVSQWNAGGLYPFRLKRVL